ncbi:MAG: HigA family addiction module antitoxin [Terriglobales bacterium]
MATKRKGAAGWRIHPGEILREGFLKPMGITPHRLAKALHVSPPTVNDIVLERRGITPEMATRLAAVFRTTEQFWLNLQAAYEVSRIKAEKAKELKQLRPIAARA